MNIATAIDSVPLEALPSASEAGPASEEDRGRLWLLDLPAE